MKKSSLKVVVAPSGFKESLSPKETAAAIAAGIRRALPTAEIIELPLVDGGEEFTHAMVEQLGGTIHAVTVTGPLGELVDSYFGMLAKEAVPTAVIEMAAAAGLSLIPREKRDPLVTTTFGVGELIKAALNAGARKILVGCGDSGTNDGGAGAAQALGVKLRKADGSEINHGGGGLTELANIDLSGRDERLKHTEILLACNMGNFLCGRQGVARIFGPQKGASEETVMKLEQALEYYAEIIKNTTEIDVSQMPGAGASGGMGAGMHALLGAKLTNRWDIIFQYFDLDAALENADLVFTAEGGINFQTPRGKIPAEVARRAKEKGLPVFALAGKIGRGAELNYKQGIDAIFSIIAAPSTLEESIAHAAYLLEHTAENVMRVYLAGRQLR